ncbi:hypothetical protein PHYBOEH_008394 [Phytophthora boehmeriae]|uniref:Uncharacterized protein n=1 Tax=Phytophthora boehmeriae TaxID=109152 RepID=A0A8T1X1M1_9STRA|nr:hypothetical protein PHYBOEH_008394 [Phytophthora boehmeriae]
MEDVESTLSSSWSSSPPLDPRVLSNVVRSYEGETLQVPECDAPVYHGKGRLEFNTGFTYTGDFIRGRMHGTGRIEWQNSGVTYEGDFTHNEITGQGAYWWPNGSSYVGDVKCGKRHGRGVFVTGDRGIVVDQKAKDNAGGVDSPTQPMLFAFQEANCMDRDFDAEGDNELDDACSKGEDRSDTTGLLVAQSNARYDGEWKNGLPHGYGELVFDAARNIRYEGQFVEGKRAGRGHMHYADGSVYAGDWRDDVKCGQGVMTWMTVDESENVTPIERYDGEWENDCQQGFGRHVWLVSLNSIATPVSPSKISSPSGSPHDKNWYEGEFRDGLRHGNGIFYYANGARFEGEWKTNVKEGYGLFFYEDGRVFVGLFRQDRGVEGCYATAATSAGMAAFPPAALPPLTSSQTESIAPSSAPPMAASSSSSSSAGIMLFINDLLPVADNAKREKARKTVEHAALRINTELRALYRGCIRESRRSSISAAANGEDPGTLLESFECRRLLSQCGFYFSSGQLESYMQDVRKAQRSAALACASSMNIAEYFVEDLALENRLRNPVDPIRLEVVPWDQVVLYREFVELLVRIAHSWVMTAEAEGDIELAGSSDSTGFLADIFSYLYEQMMRERQEAHGQTPSWIALLRTQLMGKKLHRVFSKHHDKLHALYNTCKAPSVQRRCEDAEEPAQNNDETDTPTANGNKHDEMVSIRSMLVMLRNQVAPEMPVFTADFHVRDALAALNRAFTPSRPPLKSELFRNNVDDDSGLDLDAEPDAFFIGTTLMFSEFLDAIAAVLFMKQHMALEISNRPETQPPQELPLHVLVDQFVQSVKVELQSRHLTNRF